MSTPSNANEKTEQAGSSDTKPSQEAIQPRRRSLQSGFSLLARGEPQIWFTGGMLAVCLAMVASLLALIIASGLPTFWTQPVDWLALRDGSIDIGEAQSIDIVARKKSDEAGDNSEIESATSYYYRTENFDLSNTHYRWFEPKELLPAGIVRVPATALIERFEWGRLYGIPLRIQEPLRSSQLDRQQLEVLEELGQTLQFMANLQAASGNADAAAGSARARELVQQRRDELKNLSLRQSMAKAGAQLVQVRTSGDSSWKALAEVTDDMNVEAARIVIVDPPQVMDRIASVLPEVDSQRRTLNDLKRELSRLDVKISRLRVAVRQAELDTDSVLPIQLDLMHAQLERRAALSEQTERAAKAVQQVSKLLNDVQIIDPLERQAIAYQQVLVPKELTAIEQQLAEWRKPLESSPQLLRDAVARYESGYEQVFIQKQPIQKRIGDMQAALDSGDLIVCVPNGPRAVGDANEQIAVDVAGGRISSGLAEQLRKMDLIVAEGSMKAMFSGGPLTLFSLTDSQGLNHILSVTDAEYTAAASSRLNLLTEHPVAFKELVRVVPVNDLTLSGKVSVYLGRWAEFLLEDPREANTLGGVFPAIWGTIAMTLIMTIAVVPFGVMAALYLREYTSGGVLVSIIRISINNLAGVPSIVYGVFGFAFFCMTIGSFIDGGPKGADISVWPSGTWYFVLWLTVAIGTAAFLFSFVSSGPAHSQTKFKRNLARAGFGLWLVCSVAAIALIAKSPFFDGFYAAQLPNPTFGKGGLLWASLTLALLTLPVVIVATEEALSAVPNSLREGSLACGASKWQTIRRIVLPHARPGILTGAILAMARGAGEVAPLMLVGALPNAPELPLDSEFPFFHGSRNFMHLGYQIFSLGFQSQNSEAARPMVFTCTLLLILIVASLNIVAIYLRARLRRRFQGNQF